MLGSGAIAGAPFSPISVPCPGPLRPLAQEPASSCSDEHLFVFSNWGQVSATPSLFLVSLCLQLQELHMHVCVMPELNLAGQCVDAQGKLEASRCGASLCRQAGLVLCLSVASALGV